MELSSWQKTYKPIDGLIVQASAKDGSDSWQLFPIGMCYQYMYNYNKGRDIQIGKHENTVLCSISSSTDSRRRPYGMNRELVLKNLAKNGIQNHMLDHSLYFDSLPKYKFVISPEGNGIDCHRHYEALIAGCIPIIEENDLVREKYEGCPILFTKDYSEITEEYLLRKYDEMISKVYDFSCLLLHYYPPEIQNDIKEKGNHWTRKHTNEPFYK